VNPQNPSLASRLRRVATRPDFLAGNGRGDTSAPEQQHRLPELAGSFLREREVAPGLFDHVDKGLQGGSDLVVHRARRIRAVLPIQRKALGHPLEEGPEGDQSTVTRGPLGRHHGSMSAERAHVEHACREPLEPRAHRPPHDSERVRYPGLALALQESRRRLEHQAHARRLARQHNHRERALPAAARQAPGKAEALSNGLVPAAWRPYPTLHPLLGPLEILQSAAPAMAPFQIGGRAVCRHRTVRVKVTLEYVCYARPLSDRGCLPGRTPRSLYFYKAAPSLGKAGGSIRPWDDSLSERGLRQPAPHEA
jgi:hypothetical protein